MRVVWVTTQRPDPQGGAGQQLEFEFLRQASHEHEIHVISTELEPGQGTALESIGVTYEAVPWIPTRAPRNRAAVLWRLAIRDSGISYWRQGNRVDALMRALRVHQQKHPADLVQVLMGNAAPVLEAATHPRVLFLFDSFIEQMDLEVANATRLRDRFFWNAERRKIRHWEKRWYRLADGIACNSANDARAIEALLGTRVDVIPNAVGVRFFDPPQVPRSSNVVCFVATLEYRPNVEAVEWLADKIWPLVKAARPDAELKIAGYRPVAQVFAAAERAGAQIHPTVDDVRPFYWEAAVTVAPMRLGSGFRNKILHAMACRSPVVATPTSLDGYPDEAKNQVVLADEAEGFARAIVDVLNDPTGAAGRVEAAYAFARSLQADVVGGALDRWWRRLTPAAGQLMTNNE